MAASRSAPARKKRFALPPRSVAVVLVLVALVGAGWWWSPAQGAGRRRRVPHGGGGARRHPRGDLRHRHAERDLHRRCRQPDLRPGDRRAGRLQRPRQEGPGDRAHRPEHLPGADRARLRRRSSSARANLETARATLANAEADYTRKADLSKEQLIARSDLDLAQAARDQARAQVAAAQAQITQQQASTQTSQLNLERTVIRSPVDGVVLTRTIEPGQTVAASLQAPVLFQIAEDLSKMEIVLADRRGRHRPGQGRAGRQLHRRCVSRAHLPRQRAAGAPVGDQHQQRDHLSGGRVGRQSR